MKLKPVFRRTPANAPKDTSKPHQIPHRYLANASQISCK